MLDRFRNLSNRIWDLLANEVFWELLEWHWLKWTDVSSSFFPSSTPTQNGIPSFFTYAYLREWSKSKTYRQESIQLFTSKRLWQRINILCSIKIRWIEKNLCYYYAVSINFTFSLSVYLSEIFYFLAVGSSLVSLTLSGSLWYLIA